MLKGVYLNKIEDPDLKTDNVDPEGSNNSRENEFMSMKDIIIPKKRKRTETFTMKNMIRLNGLSLIL